MIENAVDPTTLTAVFDREANEALAPSPPKRTRRAARREALAPGERARDDALAALEEANQRWIATVHIILRDLAQKRETFTTDDLWPHVTSPPEPRAMGAAMAAAARMGICEATPMTKKSVRVVSHARPVRVWRSLMFKGA